MRNIELRTCCWKLALILVAGLACSLVTTGFAGELEPPVPPGTPTMNPLNELEPRRPIFTEMLPLTITDAGSSWYLVESITTTGGGITIEADFVTIDLMGFTLEGGTGIGIRDDAGSTVHIGNTIRNGSVTNWASHGISLGYRSRVRKISAMSNGGNGIQIVSEGRFIDCNASANFGHGFDVGSESYVRGCQANWNSQNGILSSNHSFISNFYALGNGRNGIRVTGGCVVLDSLLSFNDQNMVNGGAGIRVVGGKNRIDGNQFDGNNIGIHIDGSNNIIIRNILPFSNGNVYYIDPGATGNYMPNYTIGSAGAPGPWDNLCNDASCP
jgi:parallel beta-helix repeat protein